ncbi:MAG: DUF2240 family protein [Candidatus Thermoplasmatota archaeon]|nr:DUF2240 family protein [Candidatus Thermoplasmatota archaeon]
MDELRSIVAAVFKLGNGSSLTRTEMRNILIYNLRWFDPDKAANVVDAAAASGYLQTGPDSRLTPTFDMGSTVVDVAYRPPKDLETSTLVRPLLERMIETVIRSGLDRKEAVRTINKRVGELRVLFPCAVIQVGLERGADMSPFYAEVEDQILYGER